MSESPVTGQDSTLPTAWQTVKLGQVLQRVRKPVKVEPDAIYQEIGIRSHGKGIFYKGPTTGAALGEKAVFWVQPDCFIVNIVFAWEQAVAKTTASEVGMIASHRFPMYKPKEGELDLDYVVRFFKTPQGKYLLGLASPGGAGRNKTLGQEAFLDLSIPLPPYPEQRKIAAILGTWDKAIGLTERRIAAGEQRKQGLMQRLLTGHVRLPEFSGQPWREAAFSEMLDIELGRTPARDKPEYWDPNGQTDNIWLSIADLNGKYIYDSKEYISNEGVKSCRCRLFPAGTVLMSFKLTIGRAAILAKPAFTNEAICALLPRDPTSLSTEYLYYAVGAVSFEREIDQAVKGNTLNKAKLGRLTLQLPVLEEQRRIAEVLAACDRELDLLARKRDALQRQKRGLMQQLLTGRVRVAV
jgi:type I restriction enzyme, S subunit